MRSKVSEDPYAGEAQWVMDVARSQLPAQIDILAWYEPQLIPSLGDHTAAELVRLGKARGVVAFLESLTAPGRGAGPSGS